MSALPLIIAVANFVYVTGDLDEIDTSVDIMPNRSEDVSGAMYGVDIAYLIDQRAKFEVASGVSRKSDTSFALPIGSRVNSLFTWFADTNHASRCMNSELPLSLYPIVEKADSSGFLALGDYETISPDFFPRGIVGYVPSTIPFKSDVLECFANADKKSRAWRVGIDSTNYVHTSEANGYFSEADGESRTLDGRTIAPFYGQDPLTIGGDIYTFAQSRLYVFARWGGEGHYDGPGFEPYWGWYSYGETMPQSQSQETAVVVTNLPGGAVATPIVAFRFYQDVSGTADNFGGVVEHYGYFHGRAKATDTEKSNNLSWAWGDFSFPFHNLPYYISAGVFDETSPVPKQKYTKPDGSWHSRYYRSYSLEIRIRPIGVVIDLRSR